LPALGSPTNPNFSIAGRVVADRRRPIVLGHPMTTDVSWEHGGGCG